MLAPQHRLAMLRLAAAGNDRFIVDSGEIDKGGASYSIDSITDLIPRYGIVGKPGSSSETTSSPDSPRGRTSTSWCASSI